jgi:uncharacterized membrane protein
MTAFTTLALPFAVLVALIGGMLLWLPRLTRPDIYFAVTVPPDFRDSREGRSILSRYRVLTALCSAVAIVLVIAAGARWQFTLMGALVVQTIGSLVAYLSCRSRVMPHAVQPVAVREAALQTRSARLPGGWKLQAGPFIVLAAAALDLNQHWANIPARFPIHWGLDGQPNGWALRTPAGVYGLIAQGAFLCLMIAALACALLRWSRPVRITGTAGEAEARFRRTVALVLVSTEYLLAITFAGASLLPLTSGPPPIALTLTVPLAFALVVAVVLMRLGQGGSRRAAAAGDAPESVRPVGDRTADRYWKAGLFYVNPDDPALFIEKRFGIGYTINFGRAASWLIIVAVALVPLIIALVLRSTSK